MSILTATNLAMRFGPYDIFENISLSIHHGERAAIVGPNGQGKTTLLRILVGEETPVEGQIYKSKNLQIGYLKQESALLTGEQTLWELADGAFADLKAQAKELAKLEAALGDDSSLMEKYGHMQQEFELAGGYNYQVTMKQVLTGLGFNEDNYHQPLKILSGGQQTRAQLARLLLERPGLLLLDEPTNHLDLEAIEWLESYLSSWPGAVIIVSHDRYFLDKVANRIFELSFNKLARYKGNYTAYTTQRAEQIAREEKEYKSQQTFIAKEEDFIKRNIAGQRTKEAQGRRKRLNRLKETNLVEKQKKQKTLALRLNADLRSGDLVLATHQLEIGYPKADVLISLPNLEIRRGQCVALLGPNGSGKTTLLKTILKQISPKQGKIRLGAAVEIGYFAQIHKSLDSSNSVLDELLVVKDNMTIGEARNHLARFLFMGEDVFKQVASLSGGERSRLALAKFALSGANFLILDEPTNHLDIPAQEILEAVLTDFTGTILLVSHDRYFVNALSTHIWVINNKSINAIKGNYNDYLIFKENQKANQLNQPQSQSAKIDREIAKEKKRAKEKQEREVAAIEETIENTEAKLAQLAKDIEQASFAQDIAQLQKLGEEYKETEETLSNLLNQWISLEAA